MSKYFPKKIVCILALMSVSAVLPTYGFTATLKLGGTGAGLGVMKLLAEAYKKHAPDTTIEILPSIGSSGGIKAVAAGAIDIGISSRPLKDDERMQGVQEWAYAKTPFVFATHQKSPQTQLTSAEIVAIYAGTLTKWKDGTAIRLVLRPQTETDTIFISQAIPGMEAALEKAYGRRGLPIATTDQEAADNIQKFVGGVGPSTLALILAENRPLKALTFNNVAPTVANLSNGAYPYPMSKSFYLITAINHKTEVREFINFMRSHQGVAILQRTGHLVLTPKINQ